MTDISKQTERLKKYFNPPPGSHYPYVEEYCWGSYTQLGDLADLGRVRLEEGDKIATLQAELATVKAERDAARKDALKWQRIRTPTHGSCCTCQGCGLDYDHCRCDLDDVADQLTAAQAEIAELRKDAARYRLLRKETHLTACGARMTKDLDERIDIELARTAIDAAIEAQGEGA